ncbi:MAG: ATP-binding protein [Limnobacter sp.]|uniref:ATP-binding protein n=1 Tax=Limnobacter sp. TaxID=2003368 RepID=UPI00391C925B
MSKPALKPELHYSMRFRIMVGLLAALLVIMGVAGGAGYAVALHEADEIFSARLATSARVLDSLLTRQIEHATIVKPVVIELPEGLKDSGDEPGPLGHPYETKLAFQIWSNDGRLLVRSAFAPPIDRLGSGVAGFSEEESDGIAWHVFSMKSNDLWIEVAEQAGLRGEIASDVALTLVNPMLIGFLVLLLMVNLIVIAGFKPLSNLAHTLELRAPEDYRPLNIEKTPSEISPVVGALNRLFTRISQAVLRERRFTDSAAHELRTPLAALRIHAQNAIGAATEEERAVSMAQLMTGIQRATHLVDQMLTYSRMQAGNSREATTANNLSEELEYLVDTQRQLIEGSGLSIELNLPQHPVMVQARRSELERLLRNLLDNACKYSLDPQSPIRVTLEHKPAEQATLTIDNSSEPLSPEQCRQITEPYFRMPSATRQGNGLGLAMVQEIASHHGWPLSIRHSEGRLFVSLTVQTT